MRHERLDLRAYAAQHAGEQRRRALAVHVVVAVHQDRHGGAHSARHELDRALHVEPGEGVGEALEAGPEERLGALGSREPALHQDGGQRLRDMQLVGERGREAGIRRRGDCPAGGDHSLAYSSTPQASQPSIDTPRWISARRCVGTAVKQ